MAKHTISYHSKFLDVRFTDEFDDDMSVVEKYEILFTTLIRAIGIPRWSHMIALVVRTLHECDGGEVGFRQEEWQTTYDDFVKAADAHIKAWEDHDEKVFNS